MRFIHVAALFLFFLFFAFFGPAEAADVFVCTADSGSIGEFKVDSIDTIKAVVIYACGTYASTDTLPDWWQSVWDSAQPQVKGKNA